VSNIKFTVRGCAWAGDRAAGERGCLGIVMWQFHPLCGVLVLCAGHPIAASQPTGALPGWRASVTSAWRYHPARSGCSWSRSCGVR
jgi:hypothetical protein